MVPSQDHRPLSAVRRGTARSGLLPAHARDLRPDGCRDHRRLARVRGGDDDFFPALPPRFERGLVHAVELEQAAEVLADLALDVAVPPVGRETVSGVGLAIHGDVEADEVVIGGDVVGAVRATNRLELQGTATVNGNIDTKSIVVMEGAQITGQVRMSEIMSPRDAQHREATLSIASR